jgi:hypothetical protein
MNTNTTTAAVEAYVDTYAEWDIQITAAHAKMQAEIEAIFFHAQRLEKFSTCMYELSFEPRALAAYHMATAALVAMDELPGLYATRCGIPE